MKIELERTFLLKNLPENFQHCPSAEYLDLYLPQPAVHPVLRVRKKGNTFEITKKLPKENDPSEQEEQTIILSEEEFFALTTLPGKKLRKIRYYYPFNNQTAEIDLFLDELEGLGLVDFEFSSVKEKENFSMPKFCLVDVTYEEAIAGGILAGKKYSDLQPFLDKYNYKKLRHN